MVGGERRYDYAAVRAAGADALADFHSLAHHAFSGTVNTGIVGAIVAGQYAAIILNDPSVLSDPRRNPFYAAAVMQAYWDAIARHYAVVADADVPPRLEGRLFVPKRHRGF